MSKDIRQMIDKIRYYINENTSFEEIINNDNLVLNMFGNSLTIYDMTFINSKEPVYGVLGCIGVEENEDGFFEVLRIAGQKGFGKIMYILSMEFVYPKPIMISRDGDIKENAFIVIKKIFDNPPNTVKIIQKLPNQDGYIDCLDWGCDDENEEFFKIYNTEFHSNKNYINKFKITKNKNIDNYGREFFNNIYN